MADSSLDDFFAKKDKSKKKGKSKFTTSDILAQKKEEPKKTEVLKKKKDDKSPGQSDQAPTVTNETNKGFAVEDDEWKDYQEEQETDYTGLRIQNLQITKEEEEEQGKEYYSQEGDEDREKREGGDSNQGVWKSQAAAVAAPATTAPQIPEPVKEEPSKPTTGKYVPPGARQAALAPLHNPRKKKQAPNLQSEEDFPTLGGAPPVDPAWNTGGKFEKVRGGSRQVEDPSGKSVQLTLGNKFDALRSGAD